MPAASSKLVPAAIHRKLDPSLPGHDESVAELESISLPRFQVGFPPQRLTMTVLGEFWTGRHEPIPSGAFVRLLGAFGINESAARITLVRLAARGVLVVERRGRTTLYRQSPQLLDLLAQGRRVTERFGAPRVGWDGTWTVLAWNITNQSPALAHRLRTDLRELGFTSMSNGVWVSPDPPDERLEAMLGRTTKMRYTLLTGAHEVSNADASPRDAWDLGEMRHAYDDFLRTFRPMLRRADTKRFTDEDAFAARTKAVYRWFVIATLDPDLPAELLPAKWPRAAAHELFVDLVNLVTPRATTYLSDVLASFDPDLAGLVVQPRPYC